MSHHERIKKLLGVASSRANAQTHAAKPNAHAGAIEAARRLEQRFTTELRELGCSDEAIGLLTEYAALLDAQNESRRHHGQAALALDLVAERQDHLDRLTRKLRELGVDLSTSQTRAEPDPPCTCATMSFGFSVGPDLNPCCPVHGLNQFL